MEQHKREAERLVELRREMCPEEKSRGFFVRCEMDFVGFNDDLTVDF